MRAPNLPSPAPSAPTPGWLARLRARVNRAANGWHRWPREHFTVWLSRAGQAAWPVPAPATGYYADPFLVRHDGQDWLFVEEFRYSHHEGRLVALPLAAGRPAGPARSLELPSGHMSFPAIFTRGGEWYLLPETHVRGSVDLYRCERFPDRWVRHRTLLEDIDAADVVLLEHGGRWWLFAAVHRAGTPGRHLEIFHAASWEAARWEPHPVNAARLPASGPLGRQRGAGWCHVLASGEILRPVQTSARYYGQGLVWKRIVELTPKHFVETEWTEPLPGPLGAVPRCAHHVAAAGEWAAWDVRDRVSYRQHVPGFGGRAAPDCIRHPPRRCGESAPVTIVTAGDERYGRCLQQFLLSVERLGLEGPHRVVVGDLGLAPARRESLRRRFPWAELVRFPFELHPPHAALARRTYAWKPLFIAQVAAGARRVLWLDSATVLHPPLVEVEEWLDRVGVYSLSGQTALRWRCAPATAAAFGATPEMLVRPERVAGAIGFDLRRPAVARLVARWCALASDAAVIGTSGAGHNPEQALLSLLLFEAADAGDLSLNPGEIDISSGRPVTWMSSRQKLPPWMPLWADPFVRAWYQTYKIVDQWNHRRLNAASGR